MRTAGLFRAGELFVAAGLFGFASPSTDPVFPEPTVMEMGAEAMSAPSLARCPRATIVYVPASAMG